ncbi:hypothetical protein ES705_15013 [subsurface metagenome]
MAVEEQTAYSNNYAINYHNDGRAGQRCTISLRELTRLAFWIRKRGSPTGNVTMCIRAVSDDSVLLSKVWGLASNLPETSEFVEVIFDTPTIINEEVRLSCECDVQPYGDDVFYSYQATDVKPLEVHSRFIGVAWADQAGEDCTYRYTYNAPAGPTVNIGNTEINPLFWAAGGGGRRRITDTESNPVLRSPKDTQTMGKTEGFDFRGKGVRI